MADTEDSDLISMEMRIYCAIADYHNALSIYPAVGIKLRYGSHEALDVDDVVYDVTDSRGFLKSYIVDLSFPVDGQADIRVCRYMLTDIGV